MSSASSFVKRGQSRIPYISGTKPSIHNAQLLVSTGVPSIDQILGGGIAVGSCLLIDEDVYGVYSKIILKHFLADGVTNNHSVYVASLDRPPSEIIKELPSVVVDDSATGSLLQDNEELKIAWRYKSLSPEPEQKYGHYYDVGKHLTSEVVNKVKLSTFGEESLESSLRHNEPISNQFATAPAYGALLKSLQNVVTGQNLLTSCSQPATCLRVALHSLGSPLWHSEVPVDSITRRQSMTSLFRFLYHLRALLRSSYCACLITIPTHLFEDPELVLEVEQFADSVLRLESFDGSDKPISPIYRDFQGLLHIVRLPCINTWVPYQPDTQQFGFKLKRKRFQVEKLYLPPDLSETASREIGKSNKPSVPSCGASLGRSGASLDF